MYRREEPVMKSVGVGTTGSGQPTVRVLVPTPYKRQLNLETKLETQCKQMRLKYGRAQSLYGKGKFNEAISLFIEARNFDSGKRGKSFPAAERYIKWCRQNISREEERKKKAARAVVVRQREEQSAKVVSPYSGGAALWQSPAAVAEFVDKHPEVAVTFCQTSYDPDGRVRAKNEITIFNARHLASQQKKNGDDSKEQDKAPPKQEPRQKRLEYPVAPTSSSPEPDGSSQYDSNGGDDGTDFYMCQGASRYH